MYVPPICSLVDFDISGTYFVPACNLVNFSFGITGELEIRPANAEIIINAETMNFFAGMMVLPASAEIQILSEKSLIDILIPIEISDASISINAESFDLEVLPDMVISNATIAIQCDKSFIRSTEDFHLPVGKSTGGLGIGWEKQTIKDLTKNFEFGIAEQISIVNRDVRLEQLDVNCDTDGPWVNFEETDNTTGISIYEFETPDRSTGLSSLSKMVYLDHHRKILFGGENQIVDLLFHKPYLEPGAKDSTKSAIFDTSKVSDRHLSIPWGAPGPKDSHQSAAWGPFSYFTLCSNMNYYPPDACSIKFAFPNKYPLVEGVCSGIHFNVNSYATDIRCPYTHYHSGIRDSYPGIIVDENTKLTYPITKEVYQVFNTVLVEEVVTKTPIEVVSVTASIDIDSWLWSFNITVAAKCYLDLIKPVDGVMGHIKISMNGYIWYCTVEGWSESRSFGNQTWTITGRSPAMMFGDPIGDKKSGIIATAKQGQQIIEDIVEAKQKPDDWPIEFIGWEADFGQYVASNTDISNGLYPSKVVTGFEPSFNWYIPENTVSYVDKTDIDIIKDLASSIGAYVQTSPDENKLNVKPRFAYQPWTWDATNTSINWITMNESQLMEIGRSNKLNTKYQAIHIIGESIGASANGSTSDPTNTAVHTEVRRENFGPTIALYAPMVTNPYITSSKCGLEKGRMVIAESGEWLQHTLRIGALCPVGGASFNLFKIGDMISVLERGSAWFGQVTGVSVMSANAGSGFAIEQVIEIEEYRGE